MPTDMINEALSGAGTVALITIGGTLLLTVVIIFFVFRAVRKVSGNSKDAQRILQTGIPAQARILQVSQTGMYVNNNPVADLILEVQIQGQAPYQTQLRQLVSMFNLSQFQVGSVLAVKVDPSNPANVVLMR